VVLRQVRLETSKDEPLQYAQECRIHHGPWSIRIQSTLEKT